MTLRLTGDANDYAGKGLSAAHHHPASLEATFASEENIIAGNVIGTAQRVVRSSSVASLGNVVACVTPARRSSSKHGDHACEYMRARRRDTRAVGRNLAAGMSGGTLYLYDPDQSVYDHLSAGVYEIIRWNMKRRTREGAAHRFVEETDSRAPSRFWVTGDANECTRSHRDLRVPTVRDELRNG